MVNVPTIILQTLLHNSYIHYYLNLYFIFLSSICLRYLTDSLVYYYLSTGNMILDFIFSVILTVFLTYQSSFFQTFLQSFDIYFLPFTSYLLTNYQKLEPYVQPLIFIGTIFSIIVLYFVEITSKLLILYLMHFLSVFSILTILRSYNNPNSLIYKVLHYVLNCFKSPKVKVIRQSPLTSSMILNPVSTEIPKTKPPQKISPVTQNWLHYLKTLPQFSS